jgi:hypothetical protein
MTLRIERYTARGGAILRLIGRMQAEHVSEVERQIEQSGAKVTGLRDPRHQSPQLLTVHHRLDRQGATLSAESAEV